MPLVSKALNRLLTPYHMKLASLFLLAVAKCYESVDFGNNDGIQFESLAVPEHPDYTLRVHSSPQADKYVFDTTNYITGYLDVHNWKKHFFYWFFESRNDPENDPVILWLNGGPGCSLSLGLLMELGPSFINASIVPEFNPYLWNSNASVLFFDQPIGVGYSYSEDSNDKIDSTYAAAKDVYVFLELFFRKFPQFKHHDFHIAGELYGGHYVPSFASEILQHPERLFQLTSIMVGNGITDPLVQWPYYAPYMCGLGGEPAVFNKTECQKMANGAPHCVAATQLCYDEPNAYTCQLAGSICSANYMVPFIRTGLNPYDIRRPCGDESLCYKEISWVEKFLLLEEVRRQLGAEAPSFLLCNDSVGRNFGKTGDGAKPFQGYVTELLELGIPVLIYVGDKDWICNWLGNEAWTKALPWKHNDEFARAHPHDWWVDGEHAGTVTNYNNFTFLRIFDAGHMVPYDQPNNSLQMINRWISGNYGLN